MKPNPNPIIAAAATALINLWRFLVATYGAARALVDSALQAARREYLETVACPSQA